MARAPDQIELIGILMIHCIARHPETGVEIRAYATDELRADLDPLVAECAHEKTARRTIPNSSGALAIWLVCLDCGRKQGSAIARKHIQGTPPPLEPPDLEDQVIRAKQLQRYEIILKHKKLQENLEVSFAKQKVQYLKSPAWKAKRELFLKRAGHVCEGCGLQTANEIHHITYERLFNEMLFDLRALCSTCHSLIHFEKTNEVRFQKVRVGLLCEGCKWTSGDTVDLWCLIHEKPAQAALASEDDCNNGTIGFEALK